MENFDKLKSKLLKYESPLNIEEEWSDFSRKKENSSFRKKLRLRNTGLLISTIFLLSIGLIYIWNKDVTTEYPNESLGQLPLSEQIDFAVKKDMPNDAILHQNNNEHPQSSHERESKKTNKSVVKQDLHKTTPTLVIAPSDIISIENNTRPIDTSSKISNSSNNKVNNSPSRTYQYLSDQNSISKEGQYSNYENLQQNEFSSTDAIVKIQDEQAKIESKVVVSKTQDNAKVIESTAILCLPKLNLKSIAYSNDSLNIANLANIEPIKKRKLPLDRRNYISLEAFGQGGFYSFNYGRILARQSFGETRLRIGLSLNPKKINGVVTGAIPLLVPFSITQSFRVKTNHYIFAGLGSTFVNDKFENEPNYYFLFGNLKLGYKYQKPNNRFFIKAELLSFHSFDNIFTRGANQFEVQASAFWGGIGIGYIF